MTCKFSIYYLVACLDYRHVVFRVRADGSNPRNVIWSAPLFAPRFLHSGIAYKE